MPIYVTTIIGHRLGHEDADILHDWTVGPFLSTIPARAASAAIRTEYGRPDRYSWLIPHTRRYLELTYVMDEWDGWHPEALDVCEIPAQLNLAYSKLDEWAADSLSHLQEERLLPGRIIPIRRCRSSQSQPR